MALLLLPFRAVALDCAGLWHNGFPDPEAMASGAAVSCEPFAPTMTALPSKLRVFYSAEIALSTEFKAELEIAAEALNYAYGKYRGLGRMPNVDLVRYVRPYHADSAGEVTRAFSFINFHRPGESCPILVYPSAPSLSKEHYQQLLAHELYHCFQMENHAAQARHASRTGEGAWWFEGLAQYFSNWVYPSNDFEYAPLFGAFDAALPFFEQANGYLAESFFQSYIHLMGDNPATVSRLQSLMPSASGGTEAAAAQRIPGIKNALHRYAQELADGRVRDDSGEYAPYRAEPTRVEIPPVAHFEERLSFMDFTPGFFELSFPAGARYRLRAEYPPGADTQISIRKASDGGWTTGLPPELSADCDEDTKYLVVVTRASPDMAMNSVRLTIERTENEDCGCDFSAPAAIDACLVGRWVLDHSSVSHFFDTYMAGNGFHFEGSSGLVEAEITSAGELFWRAVDWKTQARVTHPGSTMRATTTTNGVTSGLIRTQSGTICSQPASVAMTSVMLIETNGQSFTQTTRPPFDGTARQFTYGCEGNEFIYKDAKGVGPGGSDMTFNFRWTRVGGP